MAQKKYDKYINLLRQTCEDKSEKRYLAQQLMQLHHEASNRDNPIIVELGVDKGQSTKVFLNAIHNKPNAKLISIDNRDCSEAVKADNWEFVCQDSADVDALLSKKPILKNGIDILYVDSKHTPQHVVKEVFGFFEYMKKGSVIFFDDIDCSPYMNGQRKDSVSNEIAFRNIFNLLEAIFRANHQSIDFAISRGSTGLARFTKISKLGTKLNPPIFIRERRMKIFWRLLEILTFKRIYRHDGKTKNSFLIDPTSEKYD